MDDAHARLTPPVRARFTASLGDLAAIAGWIGVLTIAGAVVRPLTGASVDLGSHRSDVALPAIDVAVLAATVLPTGIYLAVGEAGARQATWGKRRVGLRVVGADGGRAGLGRIALRNAVKLLPWQLGHIAVARMILQVDDPITTWTTYALSLLLPAVSVTAALRDPQGRAVHDRVAGTRVVVSRSSTASIRQ